MVYMHPHRSALQQWRQRDELVGDHLHVRDHVEGFEVGQRRTGVGVVLDTQQAGA
jgi:hypothetical protein